MQYGTPPTSPPNQYDGRQLTLGWDLIHRGSTNKHPEFCSEPAEAICASLGPSRGWGSAHAPTAVAIRRRHAHSEARSGQYIVQHSPCGCVSLGPALPPGLPPRAPPNFQHPATTTAPKDGPSDCPGSRCYGTDVFLPWEGHTVILPPCDALATPARDNWGPSHSAGRCLYPCLRLITPSWSAQPLSARTCSSSVHVRD